MATKKRAAAPDTVRSDYALMQVTLTLAVETYYCDDHMAQAHESAIEDVLERFEPLIVDGTTIGTQIIVLHSDFTPLSLTKQVRS
jgi:hypothetical protein